MLFQWVNSLQTHTEKGLFSVLLHLQIDTPYLSVLSPNAGKYVPE